MLAEGQAVAIPTDLLQELEVRRSRMREVIEVGFESEKVAKKVLKKVLKTVVKLKSTQKSTQKNTQKC